MKFIPLNTRKKQCKREPLKNKKTRELIAKLEDHLKSKVGIPRIKFGKKQRVETLINEVLVFAKHLRFEKGEWSTRTVVILKWM